jgi:hypothetical protein
MINKITLVHLVLFSLMLTVFLKRHYLEQSYTVEQNHTQQLEAAAAKYEQARIAAMEAEKAENHSSRDAQVKANIDSDQDAKIAEQNISPSNHGGLSYSVQTEKQIPFAPSKMHSIYSQADGMAYYHCQNEGVRILPDGAQVTLTGNCLYVDVLGPKSNINIQQTNVLKVSAPDAQVLVNRVDYVEVNGPNSQVRYRQTLENNEITSIVRGPSASVIQN